MNASLELARARLLSPAGMDDNDIEKVLGGLLRGGIDAGDLYFQTIRREAWTLEDGIVKEGTHSVEQGVGVRAMSGDKTGFAYSDEIVLPALTEASGAARAIARRGDAGSLQAWRADDAPRLYAPLDPLETLSDERKVALLEEIDASTRACDPRVQQVVVSLSGQHEVVLVAATDGTLAADVRPLVRLNVSVIVEQGGRREQGYAGCGGRFGYDELIGADRGHALKRILTHALSQCIKSDRPVAHELLVVQFFIDDHVNGEDITHHGYDFQLVFVQRIALQIAVAGFWILHKGWGVKR